MKKWTINIIATFIPLYFLFAFSCAGDYFVSKIEPDPVQGTSNIPEGYSSSTCIEISEKEVSIEIYPVGYSSYNRKFGVHINNSNKGNAIDNSSFTSQGIFPNIGYNYLIIRPSFGQVAGDLELKLFVSIDGIKRLVTVKYNEPLYITVIRPSDGIFCNGGGGTESDQFGKATFWTGDEIVCSPFVSLDVGIPGFGQRKLYMNLDSEPSCDETEDVVSWDYLPIGDYSYYHLCSGLPDSGTFTVYPDQCTLVSIKGNSSGGGPKGDVMFWNDYLYGCTSLTVTISNGDSSVITGIFNYMPDCSDGSKGGLFKDLPVGTYTYAITNCSALNGTGTFDITDGGCTIELLFLF